MESANVVLFRKIHLHQKVRIGFNPEFSMGGEKSFQSPPGTEPLQISVDKCETASAEGNQILHRLLAADVISQIHREKIRVVECEVQ